MTAAARLRELLAADELIVAPGVYDGISAALVAKMGFAAAYMTGAGVSAAGWGLPDVGLLTLTEMAERARVLSGLLEAPLIADADTGYGSPINVVRAVREYERAGVAAIQTGGPGLPEALRPPVRQGGHRRRVLRDRARGGTRGTKRS